MAATANAPSGSTNGAHVMVKGVILQMAAATAYAGTNGSTNPPAPRPGPPHPGDAEKDKSSGLENLTGNVRTMMSGLIIATVLVYIRSIYRTPELLDGWDGPITTNQAIFDSPDGVPMF
ncbi:hypothetical protein FRB97_004024 [Tulasnella sp. 331]|nr:hypothetical protein FRB97_004024 [Tulasnella sp. 331]